MLKPALLAIVLAALSGCKAIAMSEAIVPANAQEQINGAELLDGIWHVEFEEDLVLFVDGDSKGRLELATLAHFDGAFQKLVGEGQAVHLGERNYVSFRFVEEGEWTPYYLVEFVADRDGDRIMLWSIEETPALRDAVARGEIAGEVGGMKSDYGVRLDVGAARLRAMLRDGTLLGRAEAPAVARRIADVGGWP